MIITIVLCLISPFASSETSQDFTVNNTDPTMSIGDYFSYSLDLSGLMSSMESENIIQVYENSNSSIRMEYGGSSCLQTDWTDCDIALMSDEMNITMVFSHDSGIDNNRAVMVMVMESTIVHSGLQSQDTTETKIDMWYTIDGEPYHDETIGTEITTSIAENEEPESIKVGDTWTVRESSETITNEKTRTNEEPWEHEAEEIENKTTTTNYNAESFSNVYVGERMYETLKIKSEELASNESTYMYLAITGMPIKMEFYEDGNLQMIMTLEEYKWTNEPSLSKTSESNEEGLIDELPGFTSISAFIALILALVVMRQNQ